MEINFSQKVINILGEAIKQGEEEVTLRLLCQQALLANYESERSADGQEKYKRWELATKIKKDVVNLSAEEVTKIKDLIGKAFAPSVVGPVYDILEGTKR